MNSGSLFSTFSRKRTYSLIAILSCFFIIAAKYQHRTVSIVPAKTSQYKTVIFDLGDVLLRTSKRTKASVVIPTIFQNPTLLYRMFGMDIKEEFFKLLHEIPAISTEPMYNQGKQMPLIMADWMTGRNIDEIKNIVEKHINKSPQPTSIKNLFRSIARLMLDAQTLADSQSPITTMVQLAKNLKSKGYKLYVLSNWEADSYKLVKKQNTELFNLFDGIMVSGEEKMGKPSPEFYKKLLEKYNLNANECIFIDDEINNTQAAQKLGIKSIVCKNTPAVCTGFVNLGVMILS
ncbi:MAG: HAD-IA family hydrolase [Candidatus Dependentiae bacterium]|nr:HAD-IA family hydrolase [Candidatus Dependentiae bacterium]